MFDLGNYDFVLKKWSFKNGELDCDVTQGQPAIPFVFLYIIDYVYRDPSLNNI